MAYKIGLIYRDPRGSGKSIEGIFNNVKEFLNINSEHQYINIYVNKNESFLQNRKRILKFNCDLYHITGDVHYYAILLFPNIVTQTVHDVGTLKGLTGIKRVVYKLWWHVLPSIFAKTTTCISHYTKSDLKNFIGLRNANIISNPVDPRLEFVRKPKPNSTVKILIIGTGRNKNVPRMLSAIEGLDVEISIVGKLNDEIRFILESRHIIYTSYYNVSFEQIKLLYEECDMVLFASLHEGFGMPVIEANAVGRPVITSKVCSLPEVAGKSAILVDPFSVSSIRNGIDELISDQILWNKCIEEGRKNIEKFTLSKISLRYEEMFLNLLRSND